MPVAHINDAEFETMYALRPIEIAAYIYLRRFADAAGIVGLRRRISYLGIAEFLESPAEPGRAGEKPSKMAVRWAVKNLEKAGLIQRLSGPDASLVFRLPLACEDRSVQKRHNTGTTQAQHTTYNTGATHQKASNSNEIEQSEHTGATHSENVKCSEAQHTSPVTNKEGSPPLRVPPPLLGRNESSANRKRGSRLPPNWKPSERMIAFCRRHRPDLDPQAVADRFRDYWVAQPGQKGVKLDWEATWRNWVRREREERSGPLWVVSGRSAPGEQTRSAIQRAIDDFNRRNGGGA